MSICIYPQDCDDFSSNGLGVLTPLSCTVSEESCGMFELELEQPIDPVYSRAVVPDAPSFSLRWSQITPGCILKAPVPTRESPLYESEGLSEGATSGVVTRNVWRVSGTKSGLTLYNKASGKKKKLAKLKNGALVNEIGERTVGKTLWKNVIAQNGGKKGWMNSKYLVSNGEVQENLWNGQILNPKGIQREQYREQLFRVYSVERDAEKGIVTVKAMHITYDLKATLVNSAYEVKKKTAASEILEHVWGTLATEHEFELHVIGQDALAEKITGNFGWKNPIECMLDPDEGILAQSKALLLRDNYDLYVLPDRVRDSGVTIRRGKNLKGVTVTQDASSLVTRIIPCGKDSKGKELFLDGQNYVDSPHVNDYPFPYVQKIDYDVKVADKDVDNETVFKTAANARKRLKELAEKDFSENGVDLPSYGLEVDFVLLQNTEDYTDYAALQAVYLNDSVTVIDELIGLTAQLRVTGYKWDALRCQYEEVTLGDIKSLEQTVYSYNLPTGGVSGSKLATGSVDGAVLRDETIEYAKIAIATIEQLTADSIVALTAKIQEIVSQSITTDELYAALAQLNQAVIQSAQIDWASIDSLQAAIATLVQASIGTADIGWAQIKDLITGTAIITQGEAGQLFISRLAVTEANLVSLTTGELVVKGADGRFYSVSVDESGQVQATLKQVSNDDVHDLSINAGEKLIEGSVTAACLNATDIFADNAVIRQLMAANLDVDTFFAREGVIDALKAMKIWNDKSLLLLAQEAEAGAGAAKDAQDAKTAASSAQTAASNAQTTASDAQDAAEQALDAAGQAVANQADFVRQTKLSTYLRVVAPGEASDPGVYVGLTTGSERPVAEAFIDASGWFRVLRSGESVTSLGPKIQELGTLTIYETADGGHAFI